MTVYKGGFASGLVAEKYIKPPTSAPLILLWVGADGSSSLSTWLPITVLYHSIWLYCMSAYLGTL